MIDVMSPNSLGPLFWVDMMAILFLMAQVLFVIAVSLFAISAIDDVLFDLYFWVRRCVLKIRGQVREDETFPQDLLSKPEKYMAIMLPAWQEAGILQSSVARILSTLNYKKYYVFIGTYPNDEETQREADMLARRFPKVQKVVTQLPGPTCKADCLNAVIARIDEFAQENSIDFSAYILQDAEDIVHPLSLKLFNHYLGGYDLIQIPVFSLPRQLFDLTGGHYMDEFAEVHSKDVKARQYLSGVVPGAGVGTAYSKKVIAFARENGEIFNTSSLTEDYEFSFRLSSAGFKMIFARIKVPREFLGQQDYEIIATRELFPNTFWAAVRQKTRWIIGISLQGWESLGWSGSWRIKCLYWRDRKMLFFSHAIVAGFLATFIFLGFWLYHSTSPEGYRMAPLLHEESLFWYVVYFNLTILVHRIVQRLWWTNVCYGWKALLMVIPRYAWGALINYLATVRAIKIFLLHRLTGTTIGWDKTTHDYPDQELEIVDDMGPTADQNAVIGVPRNS
jgi:bacteriophage N4 adsorption protein B